MATKAELALHREVAMLTREELASMANLIVKHDLTALKAIAKAPETSALQMMLARICLRIMRDGDMKALDSLLNRLVGKVKEEVDFSGFQVNMPQIIVQLPSNGRELQTQDEDIDHGEEKSSKARTSSSQKRQSKGGKARTSA